MVGRPNRPRARGARRAGDGAGSAGVQQGLSAPFGQGGRDCLAAGADAFGPVADHARQLRGLDLLVPPPEIGEAGGEDGAGFDLIVAPAKAGAAGGVAKGCQRPPPSRGRGCYKRSLSSYELGRGSCRERGGKYGVITVDAV